jgi:hypothetical protein
MYLFLVLADSLNLGTLFDGNPTNVDYENDSFGDNGGARVTSATATMSKSVSSGLVVDGKFIVTIGANTERSSLRRP